MKMKLLRRSSRRLSLWRHLDSNFLCQNIRLLSLKSLQKDERGQTWTSSDVFLKSSRVLQEAKSLPKWLVTELRTDHAGEYGAVRIYEGAMAGLQLRHRFLRLCLKNPSVEAHERAMAFMEEHRRHEAEHLEIMKALCGVTKSQTALIPVWHIAGLLTGFLPAVVGGQTAVYYTISAVETFVETHYLEQITRLERENTAPALRLTLEQCCADEVEHRLEAEAALLSLRSEEHADPPAAVGAMKAWCRVVDFGSKQAVSVSRKL